MIVRYRGHYEITAISVHYLQNVHLGSFRKIDSEVARQKARKMKAEALWLIA
jgi:hypothetical protein